MLQNAREFHEAGIPFIFDPGQAMPLFNGEELRAFIEQAQYVCVNDYESNLLQERTGWDEKEIVSRVKAYITTRGPKGAVIHTPEKSYDIPPAHERRVSDSIRDLYRAANDDIDSKSLIQWFVNEQVEEEATVSEIVGRLKLIDGDGPGLLRLDDLFGQGPHFRIVAVFEDDAGHVDIRILDELHLQAVAQRLEDAREHVGGEGEPAGLGAGHGADVLVVEPAELREAVVGRLREVAARAEAVAR